MKEKTTDKKIFLEANEEAWERVIDIIADSKKVVLSTHENSDCDGLGSQSAVFQALKKLGKDVTIINPTKVFEDYHVIPFVKDAVIYENAVEESISILNDADLFILLDTNQLSRTRDIKPHVEYQCKSGSMRSICIDHHLDPDGFADVTISDAVFASTGELAFNLVKQLEKRYQKKLLDKPMSVAVYCAIMTDTISFRLPKVSADTHRIAAELLEHGVSPFDLYAAIYYNLKMSLLKLISEAIKNIVLIEDEQIGYIVVTQDMLTKTGASIFETERLFEYLIGIPSVKICMLFVQIDNVRTKLSLRSKGDFSVNLIANKYKGGGHKNASGCKCDIPLNTFVSEVVAHTRNMLHGTFA